MVLPSTWTPESLATRLGAGRGTAAADKVTEVERLLGTALELVADATASAFRPIPPGVTDELVLRVVQALWDNRKTGNGQQFTENGAPAAPRAPRDPLASCEAILARYVVPL